ncbi:hypothetical protein BDR26DRAFT_861481 [Obelidium mucronatum]|nr:hypothetical protein BDR26DRAFT_861481 [Obelidium mucronatum]
MYFGGGSSCKSVKLEPTHTPSEESDTDDCQEFGLFPSQETRKPSLFRRVSITILSMFSGRSQSCSGMHPHRSENIDDGHPRASHQVSTSSMDDGFSAAPHESIRNNNRTPLPRVASYAWSFECGETTVVQLPVSVEDGPGYICPSEFDEIEYTGKQRRTKATRSSGGGLASWWSHPTILDSEDRQFSRAMNGSGRSLVGVENLSGNPKVDLSGGKRSQSSRDGRVSGGVGIF